MFMGMFQFPDFPTGECLLFFLKNILTEVQEANMLIITKTLCNLEGEGETSRHDLDFILAQGTHQMA